MRRLLLLILLVGGLVLTAAPTLAYQPAEGATFNVPRPWGSGDQKFRIVRHVEKAITETRATAADPSPTILISTYLLDRKESVDALVAACRRGVSVRVIIDEGINTKPSKRLIQMLNADNIPDKDRDGVGDRPPKRGACNRPLPDPPPPPAEPGVPPPVDEPPGDEPPGDEPVDPGAPRAARAGEEAGGSEPWSTARARKSVDEPTEDSFTWGGDRSYVTKCDGSCRGGGGHMHSKFYAFSSSGTARHVVMVSSSNLNFGGAALGWNDLYTMKNRPAGFAGYQRIHRQMTDDTRAGDSKEELHDGPFLSRFYPMRNASRANDPVLEDLRKIRCRSAFGRTQVHVSMFGWRGARGKYLADKVFSLKRDGCAVQVIFGAPSLKMAIYLRQKARATRVPLFNSRWDFNGDGTKEIRAHTKYVLVKGGYGQDRSAYEVMTGSANWVDGGLDRGDETTLNISLRSAYRQYIANWNDIRRKSVRVAG